MGAIANMTEQLVNHLYQKPTGAANAAQNGKTTAGRKTQESRSFAGDAAVYEGSVEQKTKAATYTKPVAVSQNKEKKDDLQAKLDKTYEALSKEAKDYLAELKEKYGDIHFFVADCESDEEMSRYFAMGTKKYSCVISSSLIEKMATDDTTKEKYEKIIANAGEQIDEMKEEAAEELGEEAAEQIQFVGFSVDDNGVVNYFAKLKNSNDSYYEKLKEKRAEEKKEAKAEEKRKEEKLKEQERLEEKKEPSSAAEDGLWVSADSKEGLIAAIKNALGMEKDTSSDVVFGE